MRWRQPRDEMDWSGWMSVCRSSTLSLHSVLELPSSLCQLSTTVMKAVVYSSSIHFRGIIGSIVGSFNRSQGST